MVFNTLTVIIELVMQLAICFICFTMGSHEHLRRFKLILDYSIPNLPRVIFTRSKSLVDSDIISVSTSVHESIRSSVKSENSEIEKSMRSQSLLNERACDEIVM